MSDITQQDFSGGEVSEALATREDLQKQQTGVALCRNMITTSVGSARNRGGFKYIATVEDVTKEHRLLPFIFSRDQAYLLVWGDDILRIIKDDAVIESAPGVPMDVASPYDSTQNINIDIAQSADVLYMDNKDFMPYQLIRANDTSWSITLVPQRDGPWIEFTDGDDLISWELSAYSGTGVTITSSVAMLNTPEIGDRVRIGFESPIDTSIITWGWATITAVPTATTLTVNINDELGHEYLLNPDFKNDTSFWHDRSAPISYLDYDVINSAMMLIKVGAAEAIAEQEFSVAKYNSIEVEIVVHTVISAIRIYVGTTSGAADVIPVQTIVAPGTYLIQQSTTGTLISTASLFVRVETVGGGAGISRVSRVSIKPLGKATNNWRNSAWSATKGYPSKIALFEQALYHAGGSIDRPDTVWKSKIGDYWNFPFSSPSLATDGVTFTLADNELNAVQFIAALGELIIGTTGSEWRITPGSTGTTITPTTIEAKVKSNTGSADIAPLRIGGSLLYLGKNKNKVYDLRFSLDQDGFDPRDMTVLASHLLEGHTITQWAFQNGETPVVWAVRSDGALLGFTYLPEQQLWAWHRHDTAGLFESVCVIPENGVDVLYAMVKRFIYDPRKEAVRYVERLMPNITDEDTYDLFNVDSGFTLDVEADIPVTATILNLFYVPTLVGGKLITKVWITWSGTPIDPQSKDYIYISGVVGTTELNNKTFIIDEVASNPSGAGDWAGVLLDKEGKDYIDGAYFGVWVSGGEVRKGVTEVGGGNHLASAGGVGQVSVLADGAYYAKNIEILSESPDIYGVKLDKPAIVVHVGVPYTQELKTLPLDFVAPDGTSQGKDKIVSHATVNFVKSRNAEVGIDEDNLIQMSFTTIDSGNNPPPLQTITKKESVEGEYTNRTQLLIRNDKPLPMEIAGVIAGVEFKER